ncbi:hypothetical protein GCM10028801_41530 [Nocardioides maradonensis]
MTTLTATARETIRWSYWGDDQRIKVTIAGYIRRYFGDGPWRGDKCGCVDDRCIGFHHDEHEECHCLTAWLEEWIREQRAALAAEPIWAAYRAAVEANDGRGDQEAYEAAWAAAEAWVREFKSRAVVSFSLDTVVDGRRGISIRTSYNDQDWLVWKAPIEAVRVGGDGAQRV